MLIPRYSIRGLLALMVASALFSLLLSFAFKGQPWAIALSLALGMIPLVGLLYAMAFVAALVFGRISEAMSSTWSTPRGSSPFAISGPPKQIVPPQEME